jgi:hypothetical protein
MEGFACIEKIESLALFELNGKKFQELVLQDIKPFPGYYSETPGSVHEHIPNYAFIALKHGEGCYEDLVLRAQYLIKANVDYEFEISYGRITVQQKHQPCVRVKIEDLNHLPDLIDRLRNFGIDMEKSYDLKPFDSHIKIRKFVDLEEFVGEIYIDKENTSSDFYYVKIPKKLEWKEFVKLIISVRGTGKFNNFDAAMLSLYRKKEIIEFVRLYTKSFSKTDLKDFYDTINRMIKHL